MGKLGVSGTIVLVATIYAIISLVRGDDEPWLLLFRLLENIVNVVYACVQSYFKVFLECWIVTGDWLVEMIVTYLRLLGLLVHEMLAWPTNLVLACTVNCALFWTWCIIRTIWPHGRLPTYMEAVPTSASEKDALAV